MRSDGVPDRNEIIYSEEALGETEAAMSVFFTRVLNMTVSEVIVCFCVRVGFFEL